MFEIFFDFFFFRDQDRGRYKYIGDQNGVYRDLKQSIAPSRRNSRMNTPVNRVDSNFVRDSITSESAGV